MKHLKPIVFAQLLVLFLATATFGQKQFLTPPRLIVGIVIEEMRYEMLLRYWDVFGETGFKKIINDGAFCTQVHHNYITTQNSTGQASIVTGTYPNYHGIIADNWYDRLKDFTINSADESQFNLMDKKLNLGNYSPKNILSSTIGDELKLSTNDSSKVVSVAINPLSSVISAGKLGNYAFWFDDHSGNWITGSYYTNALPPWATVFNSKGFQDIYIKRNWASMYSLENNYKNSLPDNSEFETGFSNYRNTFPYDLTYLSTRSGNYKYLKYSPFGNTYTKDFAISAIVGEKMGKDKYTDILFLSFSAGKYCGEFFGPRSVEMEDIYLRLDKDLEHLVSFLDQEIGLSNTLIYITSDRGVFDTPAYLESKRQNAGIFDGEKAMTLLNSYLSILYQDADWIKSYHSNQIYFNQPVVDKTGVDIEELQNRAASFMVQFTGVANALPAHIIHSSNFSSGINEKIQNSWHQKRSGDVVLNLEPGWIEKANNSSKPGSGYNYDTHVPLVWFGWNTKSKRIDRTLDIVDIAPTISWILKISEPNSSLGSPILEILQ